MRVSLSHDISTLLSQLPLTQPGEDHRSYNQHVEKGAYHSTQDRGGERPHKLGPGARGPKQRQEAGNYGSYGHDLGAKAKQRTLHHGLMQTGPS